MHLVARWIDAHVATTIVGHFRIPAVRAGIARTRATSSWVERFRHVVVHAGFQCFDLCRPPRARSALRTGVSACFSDLAQQSSRFASGSSEIEDDRAGFSSSNFTPRLASVRACATMNRLP